MKILVADDSITTLEILSAALHKLGHEVIRASDGLQALEKYKTEHPDLIILDVIMHGMDGFECAEQIRALDPEDWVPIIFLSGAVDDENVARGINAGGDDYLTKPFSEVRLSAKIKAMQRIVNMRQKLFLTTEKLRTLSTIDPLTRINNRLQFDKIIKRKMKKAKEHGKLLALLFVDLDHFKLINDHLGHRVGDLLLKEVALRLAATIRSDDFIARMGGDEFAIIVGQIDTPEVAGRIANKIIQALSIPIKIAGNDIIISSSIGIAIYPFKDTDLKSFIQNADMAMYQAKALGRNNYQFYTEELHKKHQQNIFLESALKFSLEKQQLFLMYQPFFNLATREIVGMETLLRWNHPKLGMITPELFVPIAEETGLITSIGHWVLKTACENGILWHFNQFKEFKLTINLSSRQLLNKKLPHLIQEILMEANLPAHYLELELTETMLMSHMDASIHVLKEIHAMGVSISIDDFGTGYSSLALLRRLPIRALKIDKSFIHDVTSNTNDAIIVNSIISLGKNLGLTVIAEGIETEEQIRFLLDNGCSQGQGFYLSKPLTTEEVTEYLHKKYKKVT